MFVVEDGSGITGANSYVSVSEADTYFSERGVTTWTGDKQSALIRATDYIENRFGRNFLGSKKFESNGSAKATMSFTTQPVSGNTITVDGSIFTFGTGITIRPRLSHTISDLVSAVNLYSSVIAESISSSRVVFTAGYSGSDGNSIAISHTVVGATLNSPSLQGGNDESLPQSLSFPRLGSLGIPVNLKKAVCEYALRSLSSDLMPDSGRDGVLIKKERVGPIEEETHYSSSRQGAPGYPAADRLLSSLLRGSSGVTR